MLKCNGLSSEACSEQPWEKVLFHGSSVEPVVELGDVAFQVLWLGLVVGSKQEPFQVGKRDVNPREQHMGGFILARQHCRGVLETLLVELAIAAPAVREDLAAGAILA